MMKKAILLFLVFSLFSAALAGCGANSEYAETFEKLQSANSPEELLNQHENVSVSYEMGDGTTYLLFFDRETYLFTDGDHSAVSLFTPQEQCEAGVENGTAYFHRYINPFQEDLGAAWRADAIMVDSTSREKVTDLSETDGILHIRTSLTAGDLSQEEMEYMGILLEKGDAYICEYEADPETFHVLHTTEYILCADGSREDLGQVTIQFNTARPDYIEELEAKGRTIDAATENIRVLTCIVDPGLDTEYTVTKTVEQGSYILIPEDLHGYGLFLDAEGTQPVVSDPNQPAAGDLTVYLVKS